MAEFVSEMFRLTTLFFCAASNTVFFQFGKWVVFKISCRKLTEIKTVFISSSILILLPILNDKALVLFSCAIHPYIFYPREENHTEVVFRLHNALWDTDKSHFIRGLSCRIWKARGRCIFSTDSVHQSIILVCFHISFLPMLSNLQNKGLWSLLNQVGI